MTDQIDGRYLAQEMPKILLYPRLVEPAEKRDRDGNLTGKRAYSADFMMDPADPDLEPLRKLTCSLINSVFPDKVATAKQLVANSGVKLSYASLLVALSTIGIGHPFEDGTVRADAEAEKGKPREEQRGKIIFKAQKPEMKKDGVTKLQPPRLGALENGRIVQFDTADKRALNAHKFFQGAEAYFEVTLATYTGFGGGVTAYLNDVLVNGKGEAFGSGPSMTEKFNKVHGSVSTVNPIDDDEIPF